jgi:hypothetical protein
VAMFLYHFCHWALNSWFGHGVRDSVWLFPAIEICHLLGLGVLGGCILLLNFRLLGWRFTGGPVSELAQDVQPLMIGSLIVMLVTGFFLFASEAVKMYGNIAFRYKMVSLALAILFTFTIYRKVTMSDDTELSRLWKWTVVVVSFVLWAGVGVAGRAIGYV